MNPPHKAITLIELIVAIVILSLVVIGLSNIDTFSNFQVITSDRRVKLQHDASLVLEHMAKNIGLAIGDVNRVGVERNVFGVWTNIRVRWDRNSNGQPDDDGSNDWIAYRYNSGNNRIFYFNTSGPAAEAWPGPGGGETLSERIFSFNCTWSPTDNYIYVTITTCWDPDGLPNACGTVHNPSITMQNNIYMPGVSVN